MEDRSDPYESTARWLEESARRRSAAAPARSGPAAAPPPLLAKPRRERRFLGLSREIYMFAVLVAVYLNYYFMQVMIDIGSLPKLVLFYPLVQ